MINPHGYLCNHDPRNKGGCACEECEEGSCPGRTEGCACDNCFYGRDQLANELIDVHVRAEAAVGTLRRALETTKALRPDPMTVAVALSLYGYNVNAGERARKIYEFFDGACADLETLMDIIGSARMAAFVVTELAHPSAEAYVRQALERYGEEARERVAVNRLGAL